jgi:hypothetical protein
MAHRTDARERGALPTLGAPALDNAVRAALDGPRSGNIPRGQDVGTHYEICSAVRRPRRVGVTDMTRVTVPRVLDPRRRTHLHSRPHIDLLRIAGALCRS